MRRLTFSLAFWALFCAFSFSQSLTDREIEAIATDLIAQAAADPKVKNVAVLDFTDLDGQPSRLGKYLAREFSYHLTKAKKSFTVIDRSKLEYLFREDSLALLGLIDPASLVELGPKLKGIDALVYGTLAEAGDNVQVSASLLSVEQQAVLATSRGDVTKTHTVRAQISDQPKKAKPTAKTAQKTTKKTEPELKKSAPVALFRKDDWRFELTECRQAGQFLDCACQISNVGEEDLELHAYANNSRAILAENGHEKKLSSIRIAEKTNSREVQKTVLAGAAIKATFGFGGVSGQPERLSKIEIYVWTGPSGYFLVEFRDVAVER